MKVLPPSCSNLLTEKLSLATSHHDIRVSEEEGGMVAGVGGYLDPPSWPSSCRSCRENPLCTVRKLHLSIKESYGQYAEVGLPKRNRILINGQAWEICLETLMETDA